MRILVNLSEIIDNLSSKDYGLRFLITFKNKEEKDAFDSVMNKHLDEIVKDLDDKGVTYRTKNWEEAD